MEVGVWGGLGDTGGTVRVVIVGLGDGSILIGIDGGGGEVIRVMVDDGGEIELWGNRGRVVVGWGDTLKKLGDVLW